MSWSVSRLLGNAAWRTQVRLTMHDPQAQACELAHSVLDSGRGWGPDMYVRMTRGTLERISRLDTRFQDVANMALQGHGDAETTKHVYKETLATISLNIAACVSLPEFVARQAMRGLTPQQQMDVRHTFHLPDDFSPVGRPVLVS